MISNQSARFSGNYNSKASNSRVERHQKTSNPSHYVMNEQNDGLKHSQFYDMDKKSHQNFSNSSDNRRCRSHLHQCQHQQEFKSFNSQDELYVDQDSLNELYPSICDAKGVKMMRSGRRHHRNERLNQSFNGVASDTGNYYFSDMPAKYNHHRQNQCSSYSSMRGGSLPVRDRHLQQLFTNAKQAETMNLSRNSHSQNSILSQLLSSSQNSTQQQTSAESRSSLQNSHKSQRTQQRQRKFFPNGAGIALDYTSDSNMGNQSSIAMALDHMENRRPHEADIRSQSALSNFSYENRGSNWHSTPKSNCNFRHMKRYNGTSDLKDSVPQQRVQINSRQNSRRGEHKQNRSGKRQKDSNPGYHKQHQIQERQSTRFASVDTSNNSCLWDPSVSIDLNSSLLENSLVDVPLNDSMINKSSPVDTFIPGRKSYTMYQENKKLRPSSVCPATRNKGDTTLEIITEVESPELEYNSNDIVCGAEKMFTKSLLQTNSDSEDTTTGKLSDMLKLFSKMSLNEGSSRDSDNIHTEGSMSPSNTPSTPAIPNMNFSVIMSDEMVSFSFPQIKILKSKALSSTIQLQNDAKIPKKLESFCKQKNCEYMSVDELIFAQYLIKEAEARLTQRSIGGPSFPSIVNSIRCWFDEYFLFDFMRRTDGILHPKNEANKFIKLRLAYLDEKEKTTDIERLCHFYQHFLECIKNANLIAISDGFYLSQRAKNNWNLFGVIEQKYINSIYTGS